MSKYSAKRRDEIKQLLITEKRVEVKDLAKKFSVTTETIRTDLEYLEKSGECTRTHGGAVFQRQTSEASMDLRKKDRISTKRLLAKEALQFIDDGSLIYIDNASTSLPLATLLNTKRNCTIVTDSIELVNELYESSHEIYLLGGAVSKKARRTAGDYTLKMIQSFFFDVCILGMDGCHNTLAPANMNIEEVILNDRILKQSDYAILICDESKFKTNSRYKFADFDEFDCLITTHIPKDMRQYVSTKKIIEIGEAQ